jgi:mannosyl-oligosaccharide glucosidase
MKTTIEEYVAEYTEEQMPPPWQTYTIQNRPGTGNFHMVQKVFSGSFSFDVFYTPTSGKTPSPEQLSKQIEKMTSDFEANYSKRLAAAAPYADKKYQSFAQSLFSNLYGGMGYFHGDQVIDRSYAPEYEEENEGFWEESAEAQARNQQKPEGPYELLTLVPSRPFFPRGFLWDEGFHLLPVVSWDVEVVLRILDSWFKTQDEDGWIPREQILGSEARSKVPAEFQIQYPFLANPPTLFMVLESLLDKVKDTKGASETDAILKPWLKQIYPYLQRNYDWYRKTQWGEMKTYDRPKHWARKEGYRWRGRTPRHTMASGLDDYPRAQPPHPGELHVDLMAWMGMMARAMTRVSRYIDETEDAKEYGRNSIAIHRNVNDLHWSEKEKAYCDATIDEFEEFQHVCHKGYLSLFPLMTGLMSAEHEHLKDVLDLLSDEEALWSSYGIRSLSMRDELFGTEENYWRGSVWMSMNYLIVKELYVSIFQAKGTGESLIGSTDYRRETRPAQATSLGTVQQTPPQPRRYRLLFLG